jgi:tripartite-type tricarboxylate transporter receptor subunit TctC
MKHLLKFIFLIFVLVSTVQAEPIKVRLWIGFAPGAGSDQEIRVLQRQLVNADPTMVVTVEYRPGAGGAIGLSQFVNNKPAEFVELYMDGFNQMVTTYLTKTSKVNLEKDSEVVTVIGHAQQIVMANKKLGVSTIADLNKLQKSSITYGSAGVGSVAHMAVNYLDRNVTKELIHVPYRGIALAVPDLMAGNIDLLADYLSSGAEHVNSGSVVAIAITGPHRSARLPNVKTFTEQGIKDYPFEPWFAMFSHPKNDPAKLKQVVDILNKTLQMPEYKAEHANRGIIVDSVLIKNPEKWYAGQIEKYKQLSTDPRFANLTQQ